MPEYFANRTPGAGVSMTLADHGHRLRAVVLAAGQGKRMKSALPKVLHDVLGKPILGRVLGQCARLGCEKMHVVVGHQADLVGRYVSDSEFAQSSSTHLQEPQLGTGHAVLQVEPALLADNFKGYLIVTVGDAPVIQAETLRALLDKHVLSGAAVTALTAIVDDPKNYGRIVRDQNGAVKAVVEDKDASADEKKIKEVNTGIYCLSWPAVQNGLKDLKCENKQNEYYLTDLVGWAHRAGLGAETQVLEDWREMAGINSRIELSEAMKYLRDIKLSRLSLESGVTIVDPQSTWISPEVRIGQETLVMPGCIILGDVEIGSGCQIGPYSVIKGRVRIGDGTSVNHSHVNDSVIGAKAKIGPFAHLREGNSVGDASKVGNFVELKKTTVGEHTNVSHLSYVGDAALGNNVNIGAGTITANYDHITKKKERTILGDGASTGSNSVLVAPVELEAEAVVGAGSVVTKNVPSGALAVARSRQENIEGWAKKRKAKVKTS